MENKHDLLAEIIRISREAGALLLRHDVASLSVRQKDNTSPVSAADEEADRFIRTELFNLAPNIPCISEELSPADSEMRKNWQSFWLVDPLDGTKEFLAGRSDYTVNIALVESGVPVMGVVYAPKLGVLYHALTGSGAWKTEGNGSPTRIYSNEKLSSEPLIIVESHSHPSPALEEFLKTFSIKERRSVGSSLKFCLVADGSADVYARFGPTMEWDVAAGDCVFRNSRGQQLYSDRLRYNKPDLRNGAFVIGPAWLMKRAAEVIDQP